MNDQNQNQFSVRKEQIKGFIAGALIGGAIGAVTALLKAPRSGEETRQQLQEKASKIQNQAEQTADEFRSRVREAGEDVSEQAETLMAQGSATVDEGKRRVTSAANELAGA